MLPPPQICTVPARLVSLLFHSGCLGWLPWSFRLECSDLKSRCQCVCACLLSRFSWLFAALWNIARQAPFAIGFSRILEYSKNTGVGCHLLLQGIFLTQRLNLHLLHWQMGSLPLVPSVKPRCQYHRDNKLVRDFTRKKPYKTMYLRNKHAKILNKTLGNWFQQHTERIIHHDQVELLPGI